MNDQSTFYRLHTQEWTLRVMMRRLELQSGGRKLKLHWVIEAMLLMVSLFPLSTWRRFVLTEQKMILWILMMLLRIVTNADLALGIIRLGHPHGSEGQLLTS